MAASTEYSVGTVVPAEGALVIRPKFKPLTPKQGVMFVHGAGSDSTYCISPLGVQSTLTNLIATEGYTGYSGDNGGPNTWGNVSAISRMTSGYGHLQAQGTRAGKVALVSASMGGLVSLVWAAQNKSKVSCIVSVIPVMNVTDIKTNNRGGYGAAIDAAYSGGWSEATYGAVHNPRTLAAAGKFSGIPMLLFYGLTDTLCVPAETEAFAASVGSSVELVALPSGHDFTSYGLVDHPRIVEFLNEHN